MGEIVTLEGGAGALPKGHVLSYVTTTGSPTQVRAVAAVGVRAMGFVQLAVGAGMVYCLASAVWQAYEIYVRYGIFQIWWRYGSLRQVLPDGFAGPLYIMAEWDNRGWGLVAMTAIFIGGGLALVLSARAVKRGNKGACVVCRYSLVPIAMLILFVAAVMAGQGIYDGFGMGRRGVPKPIEFLWLLTLPPMVIGILLVGDLLRFLRWIGKAPMVEKPATPFLPSR